MLRKILSFAVCTSLIAPVLCAQENGGIFLSLTRTPETVNRLPTNISVVTGEQIRKSQAKNLGEALEHEVSLFRSVTGTLGAESTAMIRGGSSAQTLVLIDGRKINDIATGNTDLSTIPVDNIERVEIIRGAASAIYGANAFGGVINIITRSGQENLPVVLLQGSAGSFNTQNYDVNFNLKRETVSAAVAAGKSYTDGWRENSDYTNRDMSARLGYDAGTAGRFDLSGSVFRSDLGVPGILTDPVTFLPLTPSEYNGTVERQASTPRARQKDSRDYARLGHSIALDDNNTLVSSLYSSSDLRNYVNPDAFPAIDADYRSLIFGGDTQWHTRYGITAGGEWNEEKFVQHDNLADLTTVDRSRVNSALYLQDELQLDRWSFIPNVRFDMNSTFGSVFSPKLSVVCRVTDRLKLSANGGKAWRAPTFNELYYPVENFFDASTGVTYISRGNPNLKPEEGVTYDVGASYGTDRLSGSLTLFRTDSSDLITWQGNFNAATLTSIFVPVNISKARKDGVEFELANRIGWGFSQRLNYTYLWATDYTTGEVLTYSPQHTGNYALSWLSPWNMTITGTVQYVGSQIDRGYNIELADYTLLGAKINQRIGNVELWVRGDNLTDKKYQTRLGFPLPGVTVAGGLSIRFWN